MGDALAVVLQECRDFTDRDFAKYHPGGALGKKLYLRVGDLSDQNGKPSVQQQATVSDIIITITQFRLGAVAVLDEDRIVGIITDGDIRRMLEKHTDLARITAGDIMGKSPKIIDKNELAANALHIMRENNITQLLVSDKNYYAGVIHIQVLLKEGII